MVGLPIHEGFGAVGGVVVVPFHQHDDDDEYHGDDDDNDDGQSNYLGIILPDENWGITPSLFPLYLKE